MAIINRYNLNPNIHGAIEGYQNDYTLSDVVASHAEAFLGLFVGGCSGVKA